MIKALYFCLTVCLTVCLSGLTWAAPSPEELGAQLDALRAEQERMQGMIRQLEGELQKSRTPTKDVVEQAMKQIEAEKPPAFPRWELSLDAMYMDLKGLDWQALDVMRYTTNYTTPNYTTTGTSSNKNLDIKSRPTFRGELSYRLNNKWRIGASGWFFDEEGKTSGTVTTTPASASVSDTYYTRDYRAKQEFDIWNLDLFATRNIVNGERGFLDMNLGTKIARPNHKMSLDQTLYDSNFSSYGPTLYEDFTSLSSEHEAHYSLLAGPSIGLQGRFDVWGPVRFEGFMNQSALMGKVHERGDLHVVQDSYTNGSLTSRSTGDLPFRTAKSVLIPVTELKAKLIFDITKNVAFDIGGFFSQWWDMPVAPELNKPWGLSSWGSLDPNNLTWEERERTPRFVGATFGFSLRH
ncbi:MAG: Lpg1974 family pore-forming outer membrane protein [Candidatus Brocadiales bacterium]|nr:Lpg1974 family pore-forming outer membrane protein [Candidatus Brocadiales bacterium]